MLERIWKHMKNMWKGLQSRGCGWGIGDKTLTDKDVWHFISTTEQQKGLRIRAKKISTTN